MKQPKNIEHSTSVSSIQPLPRLGTAQDVIEKEYKSGALYVGEVEGNKHTGNGVFTWPNGAKYDGEFHNNLRHGKGTQFWPDGSSYEGEFVHDMRQGQGLHVWANKETYNGEFFRDRRHGHGVYTWPDNSSYTGTFYMDKKEGYGTFVFANSDKFEGLYKSDEREGPGVLFYPDGRQDVGLWHREKLVKLCTDVQGAFTMKSHPEFDYYPDEAKKYIDLHEIQNQTHVLEGIVNPPVEFNYPPVVNISERAKKLFSDTLHSASVAVDIKVFDDAFFKCGDKPQNAPKESSSDSKVETAKAPHKEDGKAEYEPRPPSESPSKPGIKLASRQSGRLSKASKTSKPKSGMSQSTIEPEEITKSAAQLELDALAANPNKMLAWNNTPSAVVMQIHIQKHKAQQSITSFNVDSILAGERYEFGPKGHIELASEEFLQAAMMGDLQKIRNIINEGHVHVDVSDKCGHSALLGASTHWHDEIINCLLDNGGDINRLTDEGVSSLAACHVYFYPTDSFKYNTAERYLVKPDDVEQEKGFDVTESISNMLPPTPIRSPKSRTPKHKASLLNTKRIDKLKQEYQNPERKEMTPIKEGSIATSKNELNERKLGTLNVKRVAKTNIDEMMAYKDLPDYDYIIKEDGKDQYEFISDEDENWESETEIEDFASSRSVRNLPILVSDQMIDRCATHLSSNHMVVGKRRSSAENQSTMGTVRRLAVDKSQHLRMQTTIRLLLRRGADPNASYVPMPVLFFAIKAGDVEAVKLLLVKGASTITTLSEKKGGLAPLHIACAIPGEEGVSITQLLLHSLANPDVRAAEDDSYINHALMEEWGKDDLPQNIQAINGGRSPLHIACARDDNYINACRVVQLLLQHHANPNTLCNGHSPLSLAIASGNDYAIDELLMYHADPCLPLSHGIGNALCAASTTEHENRRSPQGRLALIDKLVRAGADILAPVTIGPKRVQGTTVDYAYFMYNQDKRIAHMPYHALTHAERETFNARRKLLAHLGDIMRTKALEQERMRLEEEEKTGQRSVSPSGNYMFMGAGGGILKGRMSRGSPEGRVSFGQTPEDYSPTNVISWLTNSKVTSSCTVGRGNGKPLFRYCYECGRSVGVRLAACTRCKEVYYCSKACKLKAWNSRHKEECVRVGGGRSQSPSPVRINTTKGDKESRGGGGEGQGRGGNRRDNPTTATNTDHGKPNTVAGIMATHDPRMKVPIKGRSLSAKGKPGKLQPLATNKYAGLFADRMYGIKGIAGLNLLNGGKYGTISAGYFGGRGRNIMLEPIVPAWQEQYAGKRVWIDNYSWV